MRGRHNDSVEMIWSTTPGAGLYLASSPRNFAKLASVVAYGRYSSTSRAHRSGVEIPAAVNAAVSSAIDAVLAFTLVLGRVVDGVPGAEVAGAGADVADVAGVVEAVVPSVRATLLVVARVLSALPLPAHPASASASTPSVPARVTIPTCLPLTSATLDGGRNLDAAV